MTAAASQAAARRGSPAVYELFGALLQTDYLLEGIPFASLPPTLQFIWESVGALRPEPASRLRFESPFRGAAGHPLLRLYGDRSLPILEYPGEALYRIDRAAIHCEVLADLAGWCRLRLLSHVLALWLELGGQPVLHAAALAAGERGAALVGHSGAGKSSLTASLLQTGAELLTDDLLPLRVEGRAVLGVPAYPEMRLGTPSAAHFAPAIGEVPPADSEASKHRLNVSTLAHGAFRSVPVPLRCIYILQRVPEEEHAGAIRVLPLSPGEALMELIRYSFMARSVDALGIQEDRLRLLEAVIRQVPVRRLAYPSGYSTLPCVRDALLADLATG